MDIAAIEKIRSELESALSGQKFGKIFQLSRFEVAIDFRLADSRYLFISIEPANPRAYLIRRRIKDLEKLSGNPSAFTVLLRKYLSGAILLGIGQVPTERILSFEFSVRDDFGETKIYAFTAQLTGRSANLFLLDSNRHILESSRDTSGDGQTPGDIYAPPFRGQERTPENKKGANQAIMPKGSENLSEALDEYYLEKTAESRLRTLENAARSKIKGEIAKNRRLAGKLNADLAGHGDAGQWKRFGDLLLANVANAKRDGDTILVTDYYDESLAEIAVPADKDTPITEAAEKYFKKYTKARNAAGEIAKRLKILDSELEQLEFKKAEIDNAASIWDETFLKEYIAGKRKEPTERPRGKQAESGSGSRSFVSSDGFEILVGKKAKDNDFLTFRIAKSLDLWMHAADYPGSHVVVRNPNRKEIPPSTLLEAAQLAAFYSQGKSQPKAAVHYTQKKFVNKPKGAVPGLVSLASFKTILVEPEFPDLNELGAAKNSRLK